MIVVIGALLARETESGIVAAGRAATVARVAASAGADVQLVGKVGEGAAGDAVLLSLAQARVGHVAVLRDATIPDSVSRASKAPMTTIMVAAYQRCNGSTHVHQARFSARKR